MDRMKLRMDSKKGGRFFVYEENKKKGIPIEGKLNPPKEETDEVFGSDDKDMRDLPF